MPKSLIIFCDRDYCMECNNHSLELVDKYDKKYPLLDVNDRLMNAITFNYVYCPKCKKSFNIDWSKPDRLPRAMFSNLGLDIFMTQY